MTQDTPTPSHYEDGSYDGKPEVETAHRLRRMETRFIKFMRFQGFNPVADGVPRVRKCIAHKGELFATGPDVTMGDISSAANQARLNGPVNLYVGGILWGVVNV